MKHISSEKVLSRFTKTIFCCSVLMITIALCACSEDNKAETSSRILSDTVSVVSEAESTPVSPASEAVSKPEESMESVEKTPSDTVSVASGTEITQVSHVSEEVSNPEENSKTESSGNSEPEATKEMKMFINGQPVNVNWEDNSSVEALKQLSASNKLTIQMSMYGGFEQVGSIGTSLPREDAQTTTKAGDVVLYSGDQLVVFYGSNSWAYTRLGHITDKTADEMAEVLGNGNVTITLLSGVSTVDNMV